MRRRGGSMLFTGGDIQPPAPSPPQQQIHPNTDIIKHKYSSMNTISMMPQQRPTMTQMLEMQQQYREQQEVIRVAQMNQLTMINMKNKQKPPPPPPLSPSPIVINGKIQQAEQPLPEDLFIHFDALLDYVDIQLNWGLIDNTNNGVMKKLDENVDGEYIVKRNGKSYFYPKGKMLFYKYKFSISIFNITLISMFIIEAPDETVGMDTFPHLISCFNKKEDDALCYDKNIFQLFLDEMNDMFSINTAKNELWSDQSLPRNIPVIFTIQMSYGDEDDHYRCFYRVNGLQCDMEYINHNNYIDWLDCNGVYSNDNEFIIGGNNIENGQWQGYIGEFMAFNRSLNDTEIMRIEGDMSKKWGVDMV